MIYLRLANEADAPLVMAWRSNPLIYQGFYSQKEPLDWYEHLQWWRHRNKSWKMFIVHVNEWGLDRPVGVVNIGQLDNWSPEIGYFIGEINLWKCGVATEAVEWTMDYLIESGYEYCHTTILDDNIASQKVVKKLGFKKVCKARKGESRWEVKL